YQIRSDGNWEKHKNILYPVGTKENFIKEKDLSIEEWEKVLKKAKQVLFETRKKRVPPTIDNKILVSWNALMMKGYIDAFQALGEEKYLAIAINNATFLAEHMIQEGGHLFRKYMNDSAHIEGLLEDYALLADAYIALYQVTFNKYWLDEADLLVQYVIHHF